MPADNTPGNGEGISLLEEKLVNKLGVGFDPTIIFAIIGAVIALFQNCTAASPRDVKRLARWQRPALALEVKRKLPQLKWNECYANADLLVGMATTARDEDIQLFMNDCCTTRNMLGEESDDNPPSPPPPSATEPSPPA